MASVYSNFFGGAFFGGGFFGKGVTGGYEIARLGPRRRTPEEIREARVKFGILPARIIEDVAARQAADYRLDDQQRMEELRGELRLQNIEMESVHLEALNARREEVIF